MDKLKLRIPPLVLVVVVLALMNGLSVLLPKSMVLANLPFSLPSLLVALGLGIMVAGVHEFRRQKTTVNPMLKTESTALVSGGIYRFTRNPMYLGMLCLLIAAAIFWSSAYALFGCVFFVLYINAFQISPEEEYLSQLFPEDYPAYKNRVRRWL